MTDLVEWLETAITAAEALARGTADDVGMRWSAGSEYASDSVHDEDNGGYVACGPYEYMGWDTRRHIAGHDPASVLRRCQADRKILARHAPRVLEGSTQIPKPVICDYCSQVPDAVDSPCPDLRDPAEGYGY